jgi:uncharacterized protein (DUF1330 family)
VKENHVPAYVIANVEVTDPARYEAYKTAAQAAIAAHGGRYLVRGGASEVVEGAFLGSRFVLLEFPDLATARGFVASADYAAAKAHREGAATMNLVIVEGVNP